MNKKGFTTVELVLTIVLVAIIMATITNTTFAYRDKSQYETTKSEIIAYKNKLTKIIYDDILNTIDPIISITRVNDFEYKLITNDNEEKNLTIINETNKIGINYDGVNYIIPDSEDELVEYEGVFYKEDQTNNLYSLEMRFSHSNLEDSYTIRFVITESPTISTTSSTFVSKFKEVLETRPNSYMEDNDGTIYISGKKDDYNVSTKDDIDFNYVWYSGKLWRITSINSDGTMKLITEDSITAIAWENTATYETSWIREWLNQEFLPTLNNYENIIVTNNKWNATMTTNYTSTPSKTTIITDSVGMLNAYEYYKSYQKLGTDEASYGAGYLNIGYYWWLITPYNSSSVRTVNINGSLSNGNASGCRGVRPSINLKSDIELFEGDGSYKNPYTIKGDVEEIVRGTTLLNTRESGEYVKIENDIDTTRMFRIVGTELVGEKLTTKLVLNDYLKENNTVVTKYFSDDYTYGEGTTDSYWDYYLNNTYLGTLNSSILEKGTYYLGMIPNATSYKATVCNGIDSTKSTSTCITEKNVVDSTWTGYVGLLRVGEMFSSQIKDYIYENASAYRLITPYSTSSIRSIGNNCTLTSSSLSASSGARPTINLKSTVVIKSGSGTEWDPFVVSLN